MRHCSVSCTVGVTGSRCSRRVGYEQLKCHLLTVHCAYL